MWLVTAILGGIALERGDMSECLQGCYKQFCHPGIQRKSPKPPPAGPWGSNMTKILWKPAGGRNSPSSTARHACHGDHQATTTQGDLHGDGTSPEGECWDWTSPFLSPSSLITRPIRLATSLILSIITTPSQHPQDNHQHSQQHHHQPHNQGSTDVTTNTVSSIISIPPNPLYRQHPLAPSLLPPSHHPTPRHRIPIRSLSSGIQRPGLKSQL